MPDRAKRSSEADRAAIAGRFDRAAEIRMTPALLMFILLERGCETFTSGDDCIKSGRYPLAKYGADQMCDPCMAKLAQEGEQQ